MNGGISLDGFYEALDEYGRAGFSAAVSLPTPLRIEARAPIRDSGAQEPTTGRSQPVPTPAPQIVRFIFDEGVSAEHRAEFVRAESAAYARHADLYPPSAQVPMTFSVLTEPGRVRYGIEDGLDHWPSAGGHVIYLTDAYWSKFLPPDRRHDESATHVIHERWHVVQFALMGLRGPEAGPKGLLEGTPEVIGPKWLLEAQATYLEGVCADRYGYKSLGETRGQRLPRAAEE